MTNSIQNPSTNSEKSNTGVYIAIFIILIILCLIVYLLYNKYKSEDKKKFPEIPSSTSTSSTSTSSTGTSSTGTYISLAERQQKYKQKIINIINEFNNINSSREGFVNFNNNVIIKPKNSNMTGTYISDYDCNSGFSLGKGKIGDNAEVPCSEIFNPFFEGEFNVKCNQDKIWEVTDYNCKTKGIVEKKDITGNWQALKLTENEKKGIDPINYQRNLLDTDKQNAHNFINFKSFDMNTEKGVIFVDNKDTEYEYIPEIGYTIGKLFPVGMTFVDNNYDKIIGPHFFMKKVN